MSESKEDGGAAFPTKGGMLFYFPEHMKKEVSDIANQIKLEREGMSLRDYFAAAALQGFCADPNLTSWTTEQTAKQAFSHADAMLKARKEAAE